jgi:cytidyltransferase-related domain
MEVYKNLKIKKKHTNSVVAIGNFDGIHLGHQKVINQAKEKAKKKRLSFGIITFEPMPAMFFNSKIKNHRINSFSQKKKQLEKLKLDFLVVIKFNRKFSKLSPQNFIQKIIYKKAKCKYLYVSNNFKFGFKEKETSKH